MKQVKMPVKNYYLTYLENTYEKKTFQRKIDYIKFNFSKYVKKIKKTDISVLEIGPGIGELIHYLNSLNISKIDIIDNDKSILTHIKKKYKIRHAFYTENIKVINKKLKNYDLIVLTQVFEHIPKNQYKEFIKILYYHLNINGYIIITVPNAGNPLNLIERYYDLTHFNAFTENSLRQLLVMSGIINYKIIFEGFKIPPSNLINIIRIILQKILHYIIFLTNLINGGVYSKIYHPNITMIIEKLNNS